MPKTKSNRRPQTPKSRNVEARDLIMSHRGGTMDRIPSAKAYVRKGKHATWES